VSALTAFRVFEWLRNDYLHRNCPLARCWLLLSPTEGELATAPMRDQYGPATFNGIKTAIQEWTQTMKDQGDAADESRGVFFFSGHGAEIQSEHQVLLPSDYLAPPNPSLNDAISTNNLFRGLLRGRVPLHLLFIDACRNDHDRLMGEDLEGAKILNTGGKRTNKVTVNMVRATASGFKAWQPDMPSAGESVFGQALLEGFKNRTLKECEATDCWIPVYRLQKFVNARVMEILKSYEVIVESPVSLGGQVHDAVVTEVPEDGRPASPGDPEPQRPETRDPEVDAVDMTLTNRTTFNAWNPRTEGPDARLETSTHTITGSHDIFGSERMEELWRNARVYHFKERRWLPDGQGFVLHGFESDPTSKLFRATLSAPDIQGTGLLELRQTWMRPPDEQSGEARVPRSFTCLLPSDTSGVVLYSITMALEYSSVSLPPRVPYRWLSRVEASPAVPNHRSRLANRGSLAAAARLWQLYQRAGIGEAVTSPEYARLRADRSDSTLAGLVFGIVATRAGRLPDIDGLPEDLLTRAPDMPDAAILRAAQLLYGETVERDWNMRPIRALEKMWARGAPWTGEGLSIALSIIEDELDASDELYYQDKALAENLRVALRPLVRSSRSVGGFCAVFPDVEDLGLLEPSPWKTSHPSFGSAAATAGA
jgi:hypothetical protein